MSQIDDQRRMERLAATVVSRYEGPLLQYATWLLGDDEPAQDVVEDVFIQFFSSLKRGILPPDDETSLLLYRAAGSLAEIYIRKEGVRRPERRSGNLDQTIESLAVLGYRERRVVVLKIVAGKSHDCIGRITGLSVEVVAEILTASIVKVANDLKKAGLL